GKYLDAGFGHADRMFELRRERAVARHGGPAVRQYLDLRTPEIDHRLDREEHAGAQRNALALLAVMQNVRLVVEQPAEPVSAKIAHDRTALGLGVGLDRRADVA